MPRITGGKSGLVRSGKSTPIVIDRLVRRLRAIVLGVYRSRLAAASTRRAVAWFTCPLVIGLSARDAVALCTPAILATSDIVAGFSTSTYPTRDFLQSIAEIQPQCD